jgi:hypothetical protein
MAAKIDVKKYRRTMRPYIENIHLHVGGQSIPAPGKGALLPSSENGKLPLPLACPGRGRKGTG